MVYSQPVMVLYPGLLCRWQIVHGYVISIVQYKMETQVLLAWQDINGKCTALQFSEFIRKDSGILLWLQYYYSVMINCYRTGQFVNGATLWMVSSKLLKLTTEREYKVMPSSTATASKGNTFIVSGRLYGFKVHILWSFSISIMTSDSFHMGTK